MLTNTKPHRHKGIEKLIIFSVLLVCMYCSSIEDYCEIFVEIQTNEHEIIQLMNTTILSMIPSDDKDPILFESKDYYKSMHNVYKMILNKYKQFYQFDSLQDTMNLMVEQNEKINIIDVEIWNNFFSLYFSRYNIKLVQTEYLK